MKTALIKNKMLLTSALVAGATLLFLQPAMAAVITGESIVPNANLDFISGLATEAGIDESGLAGGLHTNVAGGDDGDPNTVDLPPTMWLSRRDLPEQHYMIDLGQTYTLENKFHVWNFNQDGNLDRGSGALEILTSTTGTSYPADFTSQGAYFFNIADGTATYAGEDQFFNGGATPTARYVLLRIHGNQGSPTNFFGLSEIQFSDVPEPTTLGLIAFAGLLRRRAR